MAKHVIVVSELPVSPPEGTVVILDGVVRTFSGGTWSQPANVDVEIDWSLNALKTGEGLPTAPPWAVVGGVGEWVGLTGYGVSNPTTAPGVTGSSMEFVPTVTMEVNALKMLIFEVAAVGTVSICSTDPSLGSPEMLASFEVDVTASGGLTPFWGLAESSVTLAKGETYWLWVDGFVASAGQTQAAGASGMTLAGARMFDGAWGEPTIWSAPYFVLHLSSAPGWEINGPLVIPEAGVFYSPDGTAWRQTVADDGTVTVAQASHENVTVETAISPGYVSMIGPASAWFKFDAGPSGRALVQVQAPTPYILLKVYSATSENPALGDLVELAEGSRVHTLGGSWATLATEAGRTYWIEVVNEDASYMGTQVQVYVTQ